MTGASAFEVPMMKSEFAEYSEMHYGVCKVCKALAEGGYEPDASGGECEACGSLAVMGLDNALIEGLIEIVEG